MAKTAITYTKTIIQGDGIDTEVQPDSITNSACISGGTQQLSLTGAADTITVPSGATGFRLIPPAGSSVTKTLKGVSTDTGLPIHPAKPFGPWYFASVPPANFVILSSGAELVQVLWL
jgi:hypothetical protein